MVSRLAWGKLDDQLDIDPEVENASDGAVALLACSITWCCRNRTDGFIPKKSALKIRGNAEAIAEAVRLTWWIEVEGGYQVRSLLKFNPSKEQMEITAEARREAGRKGGLVSKPPSKTGSKLLSNVPSKNGTPYPVSPSPSPISQVPVGITARPRGAAAVVAMLGSDFSECMEAAMAYEVYRKRRKLAAWQEPTIEECAKAWAGFKPAEITDALKKSVASNWTGVFPKHLNGRAEKSMLEKYQEIDQ